MLQSMFEYRPSRRAFLSGMTATAAAAMLGCDVREPDEPGRVTLNFFMYATPEWLKLYNEMLIPAFEKAHPGIKIRMTISLGDAGYDAKLLTLIAGGLPPDVFHVTQNNFPFYAAKNVIQPVDELARGDGSFSLDSLYTRVLDGMRYKGQLLGLPSDFSTIVMLYNLDLLAKYNVAPPQRGWTWDDFLEKCKALTRDTDGDGHTDIYATTNPNAYNRWPAWVWMNGGDVFSPDVSRCVLDSPQAIEGLKFYVDLSQVHHVAPLPSGPPDIDQVRQQERFISGQLGMIAESRYIYKKFLRGKGLDFAIDAVPMPRGKTLATTFIWGGNCILKGSRHSQEAWQFLKFIAGPGGAQVNRIGGNALPVHRASAEEEMAHPSFAHVPRHDHYFIDAIDHARIAPYPEQYAEVNLAMSELNPAFLGHVSVEQACRNATAQVNEVLSGKAF
jgi:multiple sugar transport system substrate-binding protein